MSEQLPDLVAKVRVDESDLRRMASSRGRFVGASLSKSIGGGFRASIGGSLRNAFAAGVAVIGVTALAHSLKGFIDEARDSAQISRVTEARIKSTGKAAGLSADQVGQLATRISDKTGADDEAIQSGENLLLTFTNVRDEVGKGNDIFSQATQAAVDLAASMHDGAVTADGLRGANVQLGKALNDPVKGITALTRVGVSFTDQQKKTIQSLVDQGKVSEAQKVILHELGKEFGGTAAAASDAGDRLGVTWGNVKEDIGKVLIPAFDAGENALADLLQGLQGKKGAGRVPWARTAGRDLRTIGAAIRDNVIPPIQDLVHWINDELIPAVQDAKTEFGPDFADSISSVADSINEVVGAFDFLSTSSADSTSKTASDVRTLAAVVAAMAKAMAFNLRLVAGALRAIVFVGRWVAIKFAITISNLIGGLQLFVHAASKIPGPIGDAFGRADQAMDNTRAKIHQLIETLKGIKSPPPITVKVKGGAEAINELARVRFAAQNIPTSVTVGVLNKAQTMPGLRGGGGLVRAGMAAVVGDQGRELVRAVPGGAVITSHSATEQALTGASMDALAAAVAALARRPVQLVVDGRVLAEISDRRIGRSVGLGAMA